MKGKELAAVLGLMYDKRSQIRGDTVSVGTVTTSQQDRLLKLEETFKAFSKTLKGETLIAERVDNNTTAQYYEEQPDEGSKITV